VGAVRRPRLRFGPFRVWAELGEVEAAAAADESGVEEPLTATDEERVEAEVRRMIAELRAKPSQEKEDRVGVEIAKLPAAERNLVPAILLRIVAEESGGASADSA
jgi:hypothetical protein